VFLGTLIFLLITQQLSNFYAFKPRNLAYNSAGMANIQHLTPIYVDMANIRKFNFYFCRYILHPQMKNCLLLCSQYQWNIKREERSKERYEEQKVNIRQNEWKKEQKQKNEYRYVCSYSKVTVTLHLWACVKKLCSERHKIRPLLYISFQNYANGSNKLTSVA
jgi:hypothetical protein